MAARKAPPADTKARQRQRLELTLAVDEITEIDALASEIAVEHKSTAVAAAVRASRRLLAGDDPLAIVRELQLAADPKRGAKRRGEGGRWDAPITLPSGEIDWEAEAARATPAEQAEGAAIARRQLARR